MENDLVKIATVGNMDPFCFMDQSTDNSGLVQSLLASEQYDFGEAQLRHVLIHNRYEVIGVGYGVDFIPQVNVVIFPGFTYFCEDKYFLKEQADDELLKAVRLYKKRHHATKLGLPYYAVTASENFSSLKSVFEAEGFRVENLMRKSSIFNREELIFH